MENNDLKEVKGIFAAIADCRLGREKLYFFRVWGACGKRWVEVLNIWSDLAVLSCRARLRGAGVTHPKELGRMNGEKRCSTRSAGAGAGRARQKSRGDPLQGQGMGGDGPSIQQHRSGASGSSRDV